MKGRTSIESRVAVRSLDRTLVFDGGLTAEQGTHAALTKRPVLIARSSSGNW